MNNISFPQTLKYKGVLLLLIVSGLFALINILVALNTHQEITVNGRNLERDGISGINTVHRLHSQIKNFTQFSYKFTTFGKNQELLNQLYELNNQTLKDIEDIKKKGIDENQITDFHQNFLLLNNAQDKLIKIVSNNNKDQQSQNQQLAKINRYSSSAIEKIARWENKFIKNYEEASSKNSDAFTSLLWLQVFFMLLVIFIVIYSLLVLMRRRKTYNLIASEVYTHPPTDLPNRKQLQEDFEYNITKFTDNSIYLLLIDVRSINIMVQTENQDDFTYVMKIVRDRVYDASQIHMPQTGLYRYTEGVFALIAVNTSLDKVEDVCKSVLSKLQEPLEVNGRVLRVSPGIGVAAYPDHAHDFDSLIHNALIALTYCKVEELQNYIIFKNEVEDNRRKRLTVISRLRESLEKDEFEIVYQPRKDCKTGLINCFEAFIRWKVGLITYPANYFIPLAMEGGLEAKIDYWVLDEVGKHINSWREQGMPESNFAINISCMFLQQEDFISHVNSWLAKYKILPTQVIFEVSNLSSPSYGENAQKMINVALEKISQIGISIALDDFGSTKYSFADLVRLPLDILKIDSLFVREISKNYVAGQVNLDPQSAWTKGLLDMAHQLNITVVAEGVETITQNSLLTLWGCDQIQGDFYCPTIKDEHIPILIDKNLNKLVKIGTLKKQIKNIGQAVETENVDLVLD